MVITSTPLRISFFGGGTDYPVWYREHGGAVLSTTIDKSCFITCRWLPPFFEYHSRISYTKVENVSTNAAIQHPSVRACLQYLGIEEGVEIHHIADLPARAGLGTSSAFTVGLLHGLYALRNQMRDKHSLAMEAIKVEQDILKEAVGAQDQASAAYGGFNRINFGTDGSVDVSPADAGRRCVNARGMAYAAGCERRGAERDCDDQRGADQDRDRAADVRHGKRGLAASEVRLHDILLQSLQRKVRDGAEARLGQRPRQPAQTHEFAIGPARREALNQLDRCAPPVRNVNLRAGLRSQIRRPALSRTISWLCRQSERRKERCARQ